MTDRLRTKTFEQMNVRANYIVSGKISLSISGGLEFRQLREAAIRFAGL